MRSHHESKEAYGKHSVDHTDVSKDTSIGILSYYLANDAKSGKNEDIHLGMTKESKEMLIQNRISSPRRVKERGVEMPIGE